MSKQRSAGTWALGLACVMVHLGMAADPAPVPAAPTPGQAWVIEREGTVEVSPDGGKRWFACVTNQVLVTGDLLRTLAQSRAVVRLSDLSVVRIGPLSVCQIQPPGDASTSLYFRLWRGVVYFFSRDKPARVRFGSGTAAGAVRGTEFQFEVVENGPTILTMLEGEAELSAASQRITLRRGEQGRVEPGGAPAKTPGQVEAVNLIQWCLYYPAVLDVEELDLDRSTAPALADSLAAYRTGDLRRALSRYPAGREPASEAEKIYRAALLLTAGEVEHAEALLNAVQDGASANRYAVLAAALRKVVAAVKGRRDATPVNTNSATSLLAESYYRQSRITLDPDRRGLDRALAAARLATEASPGFGLAWARRAELEFSFGRTRPALAGLEKGLELVPRHAPAHALRGYLLAAARRTKAALRCFEEAIALDGAQGNAWLGRGLCRINRGDVIGGRDDLQTAAALEPQRALFRSYLGKAFSQARDNARAMQEVDLAKVWDPNDPTPWLYSALIRREENHLNQAVKDLERSVSLNDNRALYRSDLLLDQDRAVRSSSLANLYQAADLGDVSVREAARAVTYDYANYSAHLFLAQSYEALRDPTRFSLRYETPWFNELLLANLLAPAGVETFSPNISQQEYVRLFERDRLGLTSTTELRSDGQYREVASQFGSVGRLSYALDLDWQHNEGVRPNNELDRLEWYSQVKYNLTERDSLLVLTKYQDYHSGDNFQYYDPGAVTVTPLPYPPYAKTNTAYRPDFSYDEDQKPIVFGAYHHEWRPGVHTLLLGGHLVNDQRLSDKAVPIPVLVQGTNGGLSSVQSTDFDVAYRSQFDAWTSELNQIFQVHRQTLVCGGRFQTGEFATENYLTNVTPFTLFFPATNLTSTTDFERWTVYGYETVEVVENHWWLTAGLAYDEVRYPENHRQVPISSGESTAARWCPKGAVVWSPFSELTLRGAYARSLGGVSLDESYRLEPAQLAGFSQSFRTLIPESLVGSVSAPAFDIIGAAADLKFKSRTYVGLGGEVLSSEVDRTLGVYRYPDPSGRGFPASTAQRLEFDEFSAGLTVNQLLSDEWSLGAGYRFTRSELDRALPEVPVSILPEAQRLDRADLHTVGFHLLYQHACGFFGRAELNWYWQNNLARTNTAAGQTVDVNLPGDDFPQLNFWVGYRLRKSHGDIAVGLLNATGTDYQLSPLNLHPEFPRERVVAAQLRLRF